jgi:hypothetical protein
MIGRAAFVARFLALFAVLVVAGWLTAAPRGYAAALYGAAAVTAPLLTGWSLERRDESDGRQQIWFRHGGEQLRLALSLPQLALSALPLLALLGATPGLGWRRLASRAALGMGGLFGLDLLVVLLFPWLVGSPGPVTDIAGTFLGLLTFVGAPVILWFALTYEHLRPFWRL